MVASGAALLVATCNGRDRVALPPVAPPEPRPAPTVVEVVPTAPPSASESPSSALSSDPVATAAAASGPLPRSAGHELDNFYAALRSLQERTRPRHVRVAWLGDSHGAADLWSGPLRSALQQKFGNAGPGFVHVGYKSYRHDGVRVEIKGRWAPYPRGPSTAVKTGDGVFGLGGVLLAGSADDPRATLTLTDASLPAALSWDLCYKLGNPDDALHVDVTGQPEQVLKAAPGEALNVLRHVTFTSASPSPSLHVWPVGGQPSLCGVTIETDPKTTPGVVLDTLGINGARLITPLAWNEEGWLREVKRRPPDLVVIEYGTNESGDHTIHPEAFVANLRRLLARVRAASPNADCLVLAPTDRADTEERTPQVRDALRQAASDSVCGFWDTYEAMGGKGAIVQWRAESPARAAHDGVHLTPRGYAYLGEKLAGHVLAGYRP